MRLATFAFVSGLLVPGMSQALPGGLPLGVPLRVIFVTSTRIDGNIGGLAGADDFTRETAASPGSLLAGESVTALIAVVGTSMQSRFVDGGEPIYNTHGERVANSLSDMFDGGVTSLDNPILYDEAGEQNAGIVWTGADADDTLAPTHCTSFSTNTDQQDGRIGRSDEADGAWTEWGTLNCVNIARLYGVTDVVTVPEPPLLLQSALLILLLALMAQGRASPAGGSTAPGAIDAVCRPLPMLKTRIWGER